MLSPLGTYPRESKSPNIISGTIPKPLIVKSPPSAAITKSSGFFINKVPSLSPAPTM